MIYLKKILIKTSIRKFLIRIIFSIFINKPLSEWPKWVGRVCGINLPKRTTKRQILESGGSNINIIFKLLDLTRDVKGHVAECGVFRGHSLLPIGLYLRQENALKKIYGFDSFEGLEEEWITDEYSPIGTFSLNKKSPKVAKNVSLIKGKIQTTLEGFLNKKKRKNNFCTYRCRYLSPN